MGSSGKKKTTMAKLARENKLRERRITKQAKKDARHRAANGAPGGPDAASPAVDDVDTAPVAAARADGQAGEASARPVDVGHEPIDPRAKEVALTRLRESPDEELAVFEHRLREEAGDAGANE